MPPVDRSMSATTTPFTSDNTSRIGGDDPGDAAPVEEREDQEEEGEAVGEGDEPDHGQRADADPQRLERLGVVGGGEEQDEGGEARRRSLETQQPADEGDTSGSFHRGPSRASSARSPGEGCMEPISAQAAEGTLFGRCGSCVDSACCRWTTSRPSSRSASSTGSTWVTEPCSPAWWNGARSGASARSPSRSTGTPARSCRPVRSLGSSRRSNARRRSSRRPAIDVLLVLEFDRDFSLITAPDFVRDVLVARRARRARGDGGQFHVRLQG